MAQSLPLQKKVKKLRLVITLILLLVVLGIVAGVGGFVWYNHSVNTPASDITEPMVLKVNAGETFTDIAPEIQKAGGITNLDVLKIYLRLNNINVQLQVGTYEIPLNRNMPGLIAELQNGPKLLSVTVTLREGLRMDEVADVVATAFKDVKRPVFTREDFIEIVTNPDDKAFPEEIKTFLTAHKPAGKPLEGFLFPDTYNIGVDASAVDIVSLMINNLITRLNENNMDLDNLERVESFYSVLIYASTVEKEAFDLEEKKMVADIFIRRIEQGFGLGSDATILYPYRRWSPEPTREELQLDTPYNSRLHYNLPPTPICSPGIDSIIATLEPTANEYYYFLHGKEGGIYYGRTFAEHQNNINLYLNN
jgi:UPF0755 protein